MYWQQSMKKMLLFMAIINLVIILPLPAHANGLPVNMSGDFIGQIIPDTGTPVGIDSEYLSIEFTRVNGGLFLPLYMRARGSALYVLNNPTRESLEVSVLFLGYFPASGKVALDGKEIPIAPEKSPDPSFIKSLPNKTDIRWYDPWTEQVYQPPKNVFLHQPGAFPFTFSLPPGTHQLKVDFENQLGFNGDRYINRIFNLTYLLNPADHWAYFKNLHISVNLPDRGYRLASSLPLMKTGEHTWTANFPVLPKEDLHISVLSTEGMWLSRYTTKASILILLALVILLPALYKRLSASRITSVYGLWPEIILRIFVVWFAWNTLTRGFLSYPLNIFIQAPLLAGVIILQLIGAIKMLRPKQR